MFPNRLSYVENFVRKLHDGEYSINIRANDIPYGNTSLSQAFSNAVGNWEFVNQTSIVPASIHSMGAFSIITAMFGHGVVIDKNDVLRKLKETENRLHECEDEKQKLQNEVTELIKRIADLNQINTTLSNELNKYESGVGDVGK